MKTSPRFWDRIAGRYARKPVADEATYQRKLALTREHLGPDSQVFEFGCGTGSTAIAHAPFVRWVTATDVSPKMLEIARAKAQDADIDNVEFACTSIEDYDGPDASYDAVLGLSILHLVEDHRAAIAKAHRLLRPGGVFVSSTVCLRGRMRWFERVAPIGSRLGLLPGIAFLGAAELEGDIANAGFDISDRWQPDGSHTLFVIARRQ